MKFLPAPTFRNIVIMLVCCFILGCSITNTFYPDSPASSDAPSATVTPMVTPGPTPTAYLTAITGTIKDNQLYFDRGTYGMQFKGRLDKGHVITFWAAEGQKVTVITPILVEVDKQLDYSGIHNLVISESKPFTLEIDIR